MEILKTILANNWIDPPGLGNKAPPVHCSSKVLSSQCYDSSQINAPDYNIIWDMTERPTPHTLIGNFPPIVIF